MRRSGVSIADFPPAVQQQIQRQLAPAPPTAPAPKRSKYGNKRVELDGIMFDSLKELRRYLFLKAGVETGAITDLDVHPEYDLIVNEIFVCKYKADFCYSREGKWVVEDVKSPATKTPTYQIKKKLLKACRGITVVEV